MKQRQLLIGVVVFLISRLWNLGGLPIFNDESIYLDWGKIMVTTPLSFYSLYDGKQPMLMWIFGFADLVIGDPLMAGRLVGAAMGALSLVGIYKIGGLYNKRVQLVAVWWYVINPLMVFFDRQALMESAVGAVGVWSLYAYLKFENKSSRWWLVVMVFVWCVGLWIKSSSLIFIVSSLIIAGTRYRKIGMEKMASLWFVLAVAMVGLLPLMVQPGFSNVWRMNDRFALGINDMIRLPWMLWTENLKFLVVMGVVQILAVSGVLVVLRYWRRDWTIIDGWILLGLLMFGLSVKESNVRYLAPFLPLLGVSLGLSIEWRKWWHKGLVLFSLAWLGWLSTLLISRPSEYFDVLSGLTKYSQKQIYTEGFTAGYGVREAIDYVRLFADKGPLLVLTRLDAGNPESAVRLYLGSEKNIIVNQVGNRPPEATDMPEFARTGLEVVFVSREEHLAGHNNFFELEKAFYKPDEVSYVGVWRLKKEFMTSN